MADNTDTINSIESLVKSMASRMEGMETTIKKLEKEVTNMKVTETAIQTLTKVKCFERVEKAIAKLDAKFDSFQAPPKVKYFERVEKAIAKLDAKFDSFQAPPKVKYFERVEQAIAKLDANTANQTSVNNHITKITDIAEAAITALEKNKSINNINNIVETTILVLEKKKQNMKTAGEKRADAIEEAEECVKGSLRGTKAMEHLKSLDHLGRETWFALAGLIKMTAGEPAVTWKTVILVLNHHLWEQWDNKIKGGGKKKWGQTPAKRALKDLERKRDVKTLILPTPEQIRERAIRYHESGILEATPCEKDAEAVPPTFEEDGEDGEAGSSLIEERRDAEEPEGQDNAEVVPLPFEEDGEVQPEGQKDAEVVLFTFQEDGEVEPERQKDAEVVPPTFQEDGEVEESNAEEPEGQKDAEVIPFPFEAYEEVEESDAEEPNGRRDARAVPFTFEEDREVKSESSSLKKESDAEEPEGQKASGLATPQATPRKRKIPLREEYQAFRDGKKAPKKTKTMR